MKEAMFFDKMDNNQVLCRLCPRNCIIGENRFGYCRNRFNKNGELYTEYDKIVGFHLDPIEKKPLYHYYPGSLILSLGPNSCNLACEFCQNYEISQYESPSRRITPNDLLSYLIDNRINQVAFTYTEPITMYEYIYDFAMLSAPNKIRIVLVTNGYINPEPLQKLLPYIGAMNIDLKGFDDQFYQDHCSAQLEPVLRTIDATVSCGVHLELTNLIIPNLNDDIIIIENMVKYIASLNQNIPLHFSRYFPSWKCAQPPTPIDTLKTAYQIGVKYLKHVYLGNIGSKEYATVTCPNCHIQLYIAGNEFNKSQCPACSNYLYGRYVD